MIGRTFAIDDDLKQALSGLSSASVTDGHEEENAGDNLAGPLVFLTVRRQRRAEAAAAASLAALERLNRLKTEFLIGIRHQFRTALVGIEGFSELIRDSEPLDSVVVRAFAKDIHEDAQRLDLAFERMLELDRSESHEPAPPPDQAALDRVVNEVVEATGGAGRAKWRRQRQVVEHRSRWRRSQACE